MRGIIYKNNTSPYASSAALFMTTVEGWREFLTDISAGHDYNTKDLRVIPGAEMLNKLKPMLHDPDMIFYLEYDNEKVASELKALGSTFDAQIPRQSSSYIISDKVTGTQILENIPGTGNAAVKESSNIAFIRSQLTEVEAAWDSLNYLHSYDFSSGVETDTYKNYWPGTEVEAHVESVKDKLKDYKGLDSLPEPFVTWEDENASGRFETKKAKLVQVRENVVSRTSVGLEQETLPADQFYLLGVYTPDEAYNEQELLDAIAEVETFIGDYCTYLETFIDTHNDTAYKVKPGVVVRLYPAAVHITEPLPPVETVPLSENSFVQVARPQGNIVATFQNNMALDTPDTQWRELYARIFKIIVKGGNPKCKARIGRYVLDNCYINVVPDLSITPNSAPVFTFNIISEEWDTSKLQAVNYVG